MNQRCIRSRRELFRYLDDEMNEQQCHSFELHLGSCEVCRRQLERHLEIETSLISAPIPVLSDADKADLLSRARRRSSEIVARSRPRLTLRNRWIPSSIAAAALVLGTSVFLLIRGEWFSKNHEQTSSPERPVALADPAVGSSPENELARTPSSFDDHPPTLQTSISAERLEDATLTSDLDRATIHQDYLRMRQAREALREALAGATAGVPILDDLEAGLPRLASSPLLWKMLSDALEDEDDSVAANAARALREGMEASRILSPASLVLPLYRALERECCAQDAFAALCRIDGNAARELQLAALDRAHLRESAAQFWARASDESRAPLQQRAMLSLWRRSHEDQASLLVFESALESLEVTSALQLKLLLLLHREGAPEEGIVAALESASLAAQECIGGALTRERPSRNELSFADALVLAGLRPDPRWIPPLQQRILGRKELPRSIDVLARQPGPQCLEAFADLYASSSLGENERRMLLRGFSRVIELSGPGAAELLPLLQDQERSTTILSMLGRVNTVTATDRLIELVETPALPSSVRAQASLLLAQGTVAPGAERLIELLERQKAEQPGEDWQPRVAASVLVTLFELHGREALREGLMALGLAGSRHDEERVVRTARSAIAQSRGGDPSRALESLESALFHP